MKALIKWYHEWRAKRKHARDWPVERQIEWMRSVVTDDHQWLGHNPIADALCTRYRAMLSHNWEQQSVERISDLRYRLDLDPHYRAAVAQENKHGD